MVIRILIILLSILSLSQGEDLDKKKKRIVVSQIGEEEYRMRIYLNYENPYQTQKNISKAISLLTTTLPIPDRFKVLKIREYIQYKTSLNITNNGSYIVVYLNNNLAGHSKLVVGRVGDTLFEMPVDKLYDGYNNLKVAIFQNQLSETGSGSWHENNIKKKKLDVLEKDISVKKCKRIAISGSSGGTPAYIWSQIDLENSYIELDFKIKPFQEKISSIYKFMFDNKSMLKGKINFVLPEIPNEDDFYNYAFISNYIAKVLGFRDIDIFVSTKIKDKMNNVVIATRDKLGDIFKKYKNLDLSKKAQGNINLIRNPSNSRNGILLITGKNQSQIESSLYKLLDDDIKILDAQYITIKKREKPPKAKPFTSPNFVQFDKPIKFGDSVLLTNNICSDSYMSTFSADFKLYPVIILDDNSNKSLKIVLDYFSFKSPTIKLIFNIYINGDFSYQFTQDNTFNNASAVSRSSIFFSPALLKYGNNKISIEVIKSKKDLSEYGYSDALQNTIKDDSYFIIPKTTPRTELPNLTYISEMAFPFSIYPDLQNTGILITDFNADTIASAFQVVFQFGRIMKSPPYYLTMTYDINKILDKDIIVVGSQIKEYAPLYKNAPVKFIDNGISIEKYDNNLNRTVITKEVANFDNILVAQTYQSIFNPKRVVFELSAKKPSTLLKGVQEGFLPIQLGNSFDGDVWFYNTKTEKSKSFQYGKKYYLEEIVDGFKDKFDDEKYKNIDGF